MRVERGTGQCEGGGGVSKSVAGGSLEGKD